MIHRQDTIMLRPGVEEADFEQFMKNELLPLFSEKYKGPTRASRADIKGQALLKAVGRAREYVWVTCWDGSAADVADPSFEKVRMVPVAVTADMLMKLDGLGTRSSQHVFTECANVKVPTNV